jgi:hypothetical protein
MDPSKELVRLDDVARLVEPTDETSTCPNHNISPRPSALESSVLQKIPVDLILEISRHLSPAASFAFGLTCRPIYSTLDSPRDLDENSHTRELLTLLARDNPDHVACYYCNKLHAISNVRLMENMASGRIRSPCKAVDGCLYKGFSFTIFQMALKCYTQGVGYFDLLNSLSHQSTWYRVGKRYLQHHRTVPRIIQGSMIIREQELVVKSPARPPGGPILYQISVCPHVTLVWDTLSDSVGFVQANQLPGPEPKIRPNCPGYINKCHYCRTDYSIEYELPVENVQAAFITSWRDIGHGLSPLDKQFQNHLDRTYQSFDPSRDFVWDKFEGMQDTVLRAMDIIPQHEMDQIVDWFCEKVRLER